MLVDHLMLAATAFLLVIGDTTSKSQVREEILPSKEHRQFMDKDATTEHKQERVPLQVKPPANKARREQALRNILAARRRQITSPRSVSPRTFKPIANVSEDSGDMLEAQETRNGFFITALMTKPETASENNEDTEISSSKMEIVEEPLINVEDTSTIIPETNDTVLSYKNELNVTRNSGLSLRIQRNPEESTRRKKTVVMPESLYNHFRPVESNIPVEDMTQFLYFGQKINPENTTSNNSIETTSVSPNSNLRRRLNLRKFSTTLSSVPKLEVMNEEMNTALEKSTIETKKNPKIKNIFRNTGYFRKPPVRPSDPTIVTNIILTNKSLTGMESDHLPITHQVEGSHRQVNHTTHSIQFPKEIKLISSYVTPVPYPEELNYENYPSDEVIPAETQKQQTILSRTAESQLLSRIEDPADEEATTKIPYFHEKTSTAMNSLKTTTENDELRKLTRLSTWMSINPVTSPVKSSTGITLTESSMLNELNPSMSMLSDNLYQLHSSLRIVVTEPMPGRSPKVSDREENYGTTIMPTISTNASVKAASLHHDTTDETTTPDTLSLSGLSMPQIEANAYTMTNSTYLSRNYTASASSEKTAMTMLKTERLKAIQKKEKNYDDDAAAVTASVELLPPLSGIAGIEEARAPLGFSAGSAAVETSTSVGKERDKKALQQKNITRNTTIHLIQSTTPKISAITDQADWHGASTVRWNYTAPRDDNDGKINGVVFGNKSKEFEKRQRYSGIGRINSTKSEERLMFTSMDNKTSGGNAMTFYNQTVNTDVMVKQIEHQVILSSGTLNVPSKNLIDVPKLSNSNETINDKSSIVEDSSGSERMNMTHENLSDQIESTTDGNIEISRKNVNLPVFPVTPIILSEQDEIRNEDLPGEAMTLDNPKVLERPFGVAKELDPSEIQKRYRSQTAMKPEVPATTLPPEEAKPDDERVGFDSGVVKTEPSPPDERSPEVRGRNLSDKTKDKDDVLPIMHLYNTSSIFNGTMKNPGTETTTALPASSERNTEPHTTVSNPITDNIGMKSDTEDPSKNEYHRVLHSNESDLVNLTRSNKRKEESDQEIKVTEKSSNTSAANKTRTRQFFYKPGPPEYSGYHPELNKSYFEPGIIAVSPEEPFNVSEVITKRHDSDTLATQETVAIVSYILATLVVFPIAVGVGLILRRLIIRNRKVLEESDTSSEISCRKDGLNLENGVFKTSIEKAITKLPRIQHLCHETEKPPPPQSQESRWEFPRDKLRLQTVLGQGNFGQVWKAEADDLTGHQGTTRLVAVKTVKEGASAREKEDLIKELEIMQQLGNHPNVVTLLGCCTEEEPHYLILEYVMYGKLLAYLRDHRTRQDFYNFSEDSAALTSRDLTVFGYCVARGMEYLASKKIIHRDLAARNVLVDHNKLCKIADFGMSRFANEDGECIETRHGRNALPIRWMAPESLIYSLFTTKTDVWSFGILMWEIVTLGSTPYPDMAAREVMRNVQNGYRLERPSHCHSELFRVIARCWHADPDRRAEFQTLRRDLAQLLEDNMHGHYVDLESFASECTD